MTIHLEKYNFSILDRMIVFYIIAFDFSAGIDTAMNTEKNARNIDNLKNSQKQQTLADVK